MAVETVFERNDMQHPQKKANRVVWKDTTVSLAEERQQKLNILTATREDFSDLPPLYVINKAYTPECSSKIRTIKAKYIATRPDLEPLILLPKPQRIYRYLCHNIIGLDHVNLDLCNHLNQEVLDTIAILLKRCLSPGGYIFLTVANRGRNGKPVTFPQYNRIGKGRAENMKILTDWMINLGWKPEVVMDNEYYSKPRSLMFSFGWRLRPITPDGGTADAHA